MGGRPWVARTVGNHAAGVGRLGLMPMSATSETASSKVYPTLRCRSCGTPTGKGAPFVSLKDEAHWTTSQIDLVRNRYVMQAVAEKYPSRVPSGFFLADCILYCDSQMDHLLIAPRSDNATKLKLTRAESAKLKTLVGDLH